MAKARTVLLQGEVRGHSSHAAGLTLSPHRRPATGHAQAARAGRGACAAALPHMSPAVCAACR